jgi:HK97 family phage major capsid protein
VDRINELRQAAIEAAATVRVEEKSLNGLLDDQSEAKKAYRALLKKASGGKLSDDEQAELQMAEDATEAFEPRISAQRKLVAEAKAEQAKADAELTEEEARLAAEATRAVETPSGRIQISPPNSDTDPRRGFADHREFMRCVMHAGMGRGVDERLRPLATQGTDEQQSAAQPYGGFLVPVGVAPGILSVSPETDPLTPFIRNVPLMSPIVTFNARVDKDHSSSVSGGLTVSRTPETVDATASRMQFEQVVMTANEEVGLAYATEKILTDSPESFVALLSAGFADEYVANAMNERINGTGLGERQGVLNTPCLVTVAKEAGQAATTIVTENIDKMAARCWRYSQSVWLANHNTRPQLRGLVRAVGTGGSIVPYFDARWAPDLLLGVRCGARHGR